jgi:thiol:disulfide interchange protein
VAEEIEVSSHPMPHIEGGVTIQEYGEMLTSHEKAALVINQVYIQVTKHLCVHHHATHSATLMTQIFCSPQSLKRAGKRITVLEVYAPWCRKCLKMSREVFKACAKYKDEVELSPLLIERGGSHCAVKL